MSNFTKYAHVVNCLNQSELELGLGPGLGLGLELGLRRSLSGEEAAGRGQAAGQFLRPW